MPAAHDDDAARRSVVPQAAGRSLWLAAVWTGVGAAVVCATIAIVAVSILWLPVSGAGGRTNSAIRGGLLTFLAALHGGITVDGTHAAFVPLGLTLIVALTAWRAGSGLADAAEALGEQSAIRVGIAGLLQALAFTGACEVARHYATLGTSSASTVGVGVGAFVLFVVAGGGGLARSSALGEVGRSDAVRAGARAALTVALVYLAAGAVLAAGSLAVHHGEVETLSRQVGGGWGGLPILLLGILAGPNAAIAGSSYLAGPGFTFGAGTSATLTGTAHGTLPAFPVLAAIPSGHGASSPVWVLVVLTPLVAGLLVARIAARSGGWGHRLAATGWAVVLVAAVMAGLGWLGGGAIGTGRLATVGASPWRLGGATAVAVAAAAGLGLGLAALWQLRTAHGIDFEEESDADIADSEAWSDTTEADVRYEGIDFTDTRPTAPLPTVVRRRLPVTPPAEAGEGKELAG